MRDEQTAFHNLLLALLPCPNSCDVPQLDLWGPTRRMTSRPRTSEIDFSPSPFVESRYLQRVVLRKQVQRLRCGTGCLDNVAGKCFSEESGVGCQKAAVSTFDDNAAMIYGWQCGESAIWKVFFNNDKNA